MESLGDRSSEREIENLLEQADVAGDENDMISVEDFIRVMRHRVNYRPSPSQIAKAFNIFDNDGNGYVSTAELRRVRPRYLLDRSTGPAPAHTIPGCCSPHGPVPFLTTTVVAVVLVLVGL